MTRMAIQALLLALVYLAVLGSTEPLDLAAGWVIGFGLLAALRPSRPAEQPLTGDERRPPALRRAVAAPWLAVGVLAQVTGGVWDVGLRVLGVRPVEHAGEVRVPMGERTPVGAAVSALCFGYAPGGMVLEIDEERHELLVHVMDARDPDRVRADLDRFYERFQRHCFP